MSQSSNLYPAASAAVLSRYSLLLTALFMLLVSIVFIWFANDLLQSFDKEIKEWNEYRSYGIVRSMGVELEDELQVLAHKPDNTELAVILKKILESNEAVVDLALINNSSQLLAYAGGNKTLVDYLLKSKLVKLSSKDVVINYDKNVILNNIYINGVSDVKNAEINFDFGVLNLKLYEGQTLDLLVVFKPLAFDSPKPYIFMVSLALVLVLGLLVWEFIHYLNHKIYLEPVAHLNVLAKDLEAGQWPLASATGKDHASSSILQLASQCLSRCHQEWLHWKWQLGKVQQGLPSHSVKMQALKAPLMLTTPAVHSFIPASVLHLHLFINVAVCTSLLMLPAYLPEWLHAIFMLGIFICSLAWLPRHLRVASIGSLIRGGLVGGVLGAILYSLLSNSGVTLNIYATLSVYLLCMGACGWFIYSVLALRKKLS